MSITSINKNWLTEDENQIREMGTANAIFLCTTVKLYA